jgi:zinc protease
MRTRSIFALLLVCALALAAYPRITGAQQAPAKASGKAPGKAQAAAPATAPPRAVRPPRLAIQQHTLANGLRVLIVEDHSAPVANLQMWYHVGSKDEREGRTGFAHLFEHLMFKGSAHVGADEHSRIIEAVGGFDNAYTNFDTTVYWQTFPSNFLERVIWLEADRLGSLNVDETNFASEREVVKEERRQRVENRPYGQVSGDLYAAAFKVHPYSHEPIGSMEDLNKAGIEDVREFFRTYYRPDNCTMVIVGDVNPVQALAWVRKHFSGIPRPAAAVPRIAAQEPPQSAEFRVTKSYGTNSPLPAVVAGYRMPAIYSDDYYALNLAANILSQGESSRIYRKLVYEDRVALGAAGFPLFTEHPNLFWAYAIMNQGKTLEEGEQALFAVLEKMKQEPVSAEELEKAKNQVISDFVVGRRTVQQKADAIGQAAVLGKNAELVNLDLARYQAVTAADIQRVARKYFDPKQRTVLIIEPPKSGQGQE